MKNKNKVQKKMIGNLLCTIVMVSLLFICMNSTSVQAANKKITLYQYHPNEQLAYDSGVLGDCYYDLYPSEKHYDYKKFLKYTYKISDDSVIGIAINKDINFHSSIIMNDDKGNLLALYPYDVKVFALGPGTSTLMVYNGKKLIDSYTFKVVADKKYSPSSFVNDTDDALCSIQIGTDEEIATEMNLIKKFAKTAADSKYLTTNQRVLAALNACIAYGGELMSEEEYEKWYNSLKYDEFFRYESVNSRLIEKKATATGYAKTNKTILNNLGFRCTNEISPYYSSYNTIKLYKVNEEYEEELKLREKNPEEFAGDEGEVWIDDLKKGEFNLVYFTATTKLTSDYDMTTEESSSIFKKTHLPAWVIGEDTSQQVIDVGQTQSLTASDMNSNIFSSDTSVVTTADGKITGVNPGVAVVYRYNDTYCDMFFVLVSKKGSAKTVQAKVYTKTSKLYFTSSEYAPYLKGGQSDIYQIKDWDQLRLYELEPVLGHGGLLKTKYSKGIVKCYLEYEGETELLCTIGTGR